MRASSSARSSAGGMVPAATSGCSTRTTTAVMLSWPPPALARSISFLGSALTSSPLSRSMMRASFRYACRPSEQSRNWSPGRISKSIVSPWTCLVDADRARDRVLVRLVRGGLEAFLGDAAAADQLVDQRVVLGELDDLAGAQHVDAAVADVGDEAAVARNQQGGRGRAHAALLGLGLALLVHGLAGGLDGGLEQRQEVLRADARVALRELVDRFAAGLDRVAELVHGELRRDLARGVAAHAVGDHEQRKLLVDEEIVLVDLALLADVGGGPEG